MRPRTTTKLWTVAALVGLVAIISLANNYYLGRRYEPTQSMGSLHWDGRPGKGTAPKATPMIIEVPPRDNDAPPTEKMVPVSLHCKQVCMT